MKKVLFVCIHNSARSQMAEALLDKYGEDLFEVESAGFEPGTLNPVVVDVLREDEDIDISRNETNSVFDFFKEGKQFNYVVTVCDEGNAQKCPIFPGLSYRINWSFEDPNSFVGDEQGRISQTRVVKDAIKTKILEFVDMVKSGKIDENWKVN